MTWVNEAVWYKGDWWKQKTVQKEQILAARAAQLSKFVDNVVPELLAASFSSIGLQTEGEGFDLEAEVDFETDSEAEFYSQ